MKAKYDAAVTHVTGPSAVYYIIQYNTYRVSVTCEIIFSSGKWGYVLFTSITSLTLRSLYMHMQ